MSQGAAAVILALEPAASGSKPRRPEGATKKDDRTVIPAFKVNPSNAKALPQAPDPRN
jgi:hypothetical protein